jgi:hypothetical protein
MAGITSGGKRTVFFSKSKGDTQIGAESSWNSGRSGHHKRKNKGHY